MGSRIGDITGRTNIPVELLRYEGKVTNTATTTVDNKCKTIAVDVKPELFAHSLVVDRSKTEEGIITISLVDQNGTEISCDYFDLDVEAVIDRAELDYVNKQLIFYRRNGDSFPCDISDLINDFESRLNAEVVRAQSEEQKLADSIEEEARIREEKDVWEKGPGEGSVQTKGTGCVAEGKFSVAEGWTSKTLKKGTDPVSGQAAHAEGAETNASGFGAHSEGGRTTAEGDHAHAEGYETTALGDDSHTEGNHTITNNFAEHAEGKFNISHANSDMPDRNGTISSIGIGTAEVDPEGRFIGKKNAVEIMQNGDQYILGIGGYDGKDIENAKTVQEIINAKAEQSDLEAETRRAIAEENKKLNKENPGVFSAYTIDATGEQGTKEISASARQYSIAYRGIGGKLIVGEPSDDNHATTKQYVDNSITILDTKLNQEINDRDAEVSRVESLLSQEAARAKQEEGNLLTLITAETARATTKEAELEAAILQAGKVDDVLVDGESVVEDKIANIDLSGKQDVIEDLETIREGAALGATAVQPEDMPEVRIDNISELPQPADEYKNIIYRVNDELYQCLSKGGANTEALKEDKNEVVNYDWTFENVLGTSEITNAGWATFCEDVGNDFGDYFTPAALSKIYRNNGAVRFGSASYAGEFTINCSLSEVSTIELSFIRYGSENAEIDYIISDADNSASGSVISTSAEEPVKIYCRQVFNSPTISLVTSKPSGVTDAGFRTILKEIKIITGQGAVYEWHNITREYADKISNEINERIDNLNLEKRNTGYIVNVSQEAGQLDATYETKIKDISEHLTSDNLVTAAAVVAFTSPVIDRVSQLETRTDAIETDLETKANKLETLAYEEVETLPATFTANDLGKIFRVNNALYQIVEVTPTEDLYVTLNKDTCTLVEDEEEQLVAEVHNFEETDEVIWSSDNEDVAVVNETGLVLAGSIGEAVITATSVEDPTAKATCIVTVVETPADITDIELDQHEIEVYNLDPIYLTATPTPEGVAHTTQWTSSDENVATVVSYEGNPDLGYVQFHDYGIVEITVTATGTSAVVSDSCIIDAVRPTPSTEDVNYNFASEAHVTAAFTPVKVVEVLGRTCTSDNNIITEDSQVTTANTYTENSASSGNVGNLKFSSAKNNGSLTLRAPSDVAYVGIKFTAKAYGSDTSALTCNGTNINLTSDYAEYSLDFDNVSELTLEATKRVLISDLTLIIKRANRSIKKAILRKAVANDTTIYAAKRLLTEDDTAPISITGEEIATGLVSKDVIEQLKINPYRPLYMRSKDSRSGSSAEIFTYSGTSDCFVKGGSIIDWLFSSISSNVLTVISIDSHRGITKTSYNLVTATTDGDVSVSKLTIGDTELTEEKLTKLLALLDAMEVQDN